MPEISTGLPRQTPTPEQMVAPQPSVDFATLYNLPVVPAEIPLLPASIPSEPEFIEQLTPELIEMPEDVVATTTGFDESLERVITATDDELLFAEIEINQPVAEMETVEEFIVTEVDIAPEAELISEAITYLENPVENTPQSFETLDAKNEFIAATALAAETANEMNSWMESEFDPEWDNIIYVQENHSYHPAWQPLFNAANTLRQPELITESMTALTALPDAQQITEFRTELANLPAEMQEFKAEAAELLTSVEIINSLPETAATQVLEYLSAAEVTPTTNVQVLVEALVITEVQAVEFIAEVHAGKQTEKINQQIPPSIELPHGVEVADLFAQQVKSIDGTREQVLRLRYLHSVALKWLERELRKGERSPLQLLKAAYWMLYELIHAELNKPGGRWLLPPSFSIVFVINNQVYPILWGEKAGVIYDAVQIKVTPPKRMRALFTGRNDKLMNVQNYLASHELGSEIILDTDWDSKFAAVVSHDLTNEFVREQLENRQIKDIQHFEVQNEHVEVLGNSQKLPKAIDVYPTLLRPDVIQTEI